MCSSLTFCAPHKDYVMKNPYFWKQKHAMKKLYTLLTALALTLQLAAQEQPLAGFAYGKQDAPTGQEWENPEQLALNKEQPHAYAFHFANEREALGVLPEKSSYYKNLNGTWKFHWVKTPEERPKDFFLPNYDVSGWDDMPVPSCWNIMGIQKDGSLKYGVPVYVNQKVIFQHKVAVGDWKGGVMREPAKDWTTYIYRNEVGSYRRTFTLPAGWAERVTYLNFDGVDSFFYLWINGQYVGFSKNSRNTARFDITPYLKNGENTLAVEVYRNSDASYLESQDMFRLPGIIRDVYLTSAPKVQLEDLVIQTTGMGKVKNLQARTEFKVRALIRNTSTADAKDYQLSYAVYPVKLYSDETLGCMTETAAGKLTVSRQGQGWQEKVLTLENAQLWSAETPYRYVLLATLKDAKGQVVDRKSTYFGACMVEIKDTSAADDEFGKAGRYYYLNHQPVKFKGVNRHETNPATGHALTREQMLQEVMLMKRGNINHVRTSHYSNDPYWFYLCNKYGIYLESEANLESHQYYYRDASLSHPVEWKAAHVARNMEMVHQHVNNPCINIWSLGNEAGPGDNFKAAYTAIKAFDPRPVQYERNNRIVDMGSNQYPDVPWVWEAALGKANEIYPFHISEYAHSMGNAGGNLADIWEAIESSNFICGGAIWDWVDQAMLTYTTDGTPYYAYGGDFGDKPNDGMFCMNGILLPDFSPKPEYHEVKKVYQNVGFKYLGNNRIEVFNKHYFTSLKNYRLRWTLLEDGVPVATDLLTDDLGLIGPRTKATLVVNCTKELQNGKEYLLNVELLLKEDEPWARKDYVQMAEQLLLQKGAVPTLTAQKGKLKLSRSKETITVQGQDFAVSFNHQTGSIETLIYQGKEIIAKGNGPRLDALRAPVDNDNWFYEDWYRKGLHNLQAEVLTWDLQKRKDGSIQLSYTVKNQAPEQAQIKGGASGKYTVTELTDSTQTFSLTAEQVWTIYPDGKICLKSEITPSDAEVVLPRLGYLFKLPATLQNYTYYGRGPWNNYSDRMSGSFLGIYESSVKDHFVNFPKPQDMANREEVRWCTLTDNTEAGIRFTATTDMAASVLPWSDMQLTLAHHPHELPESDGTYLHLDAKVTGLGGTSCGQDIPLEKDRVKGTYTLGFVLEPVY